MLVAIAVQLDFPGGTLEEYDEGLESIGFLPGGPAARGELFHWVTATDDGIRVVDVWESREAFDSYYEKRVLPVLSEVGAPDPPVIHVFDVHNYFVGGRPRT